MVAFFRSEVFKNVFFCTVLTVFFQIEAFHASFLGDFCFQSFQIFTGGYASLNTIQHCQVECSDGNVGVGVRVGRTHFDTGSLVIIKVTNQACKNGSVTGRVIGAHTQRGYNADRSFEARFQTIEGVNGAGDKGVDYFVVFQQAHHTTVANGRKEILVHIFGREQIDNLTVLHFSSNAYVNVLAITSNTGNGFCLEGNFQTVHTEHFFNYDARQKFVIRSLYANVKLPVHFQLFHNVGHMTATVDLSFNTATFLVTHFRFQAVEFQSLDGLFQSSTYVTAGTLPILLLHDLRGVQCFNRSIFRRRFYPKFQLSCAGEDKLFNISKVYVLQACDYRVLLKHGKQFFFYVVKGVLQNRTGANVIVVMNKVAGNTQGTNHFAAFCVKMLVVVIHVPVYRFIYGQIYTSVVQGSNARQNYGRTVSLGSTAFQKVSSIFQENFHRNFFVSIITGKIHTH